MHVDKYCFRAPYVAALLRRGLGLPDGSAYHVDGGSVAWTLGAPPSLLKPYHRVPITSAAGFQALGRRRCRPRRSRQRRLARKMASGTCVSVLCPGDKVCNAAGGNMAVPGLEGSATAEIVRWRSMPSRSKSAFLLVRQPATLASVEVFQ